MPTRKKIGLIGAGNIGGELARLCANAQLGDVYLFDIAAKEKIQSIVERTRKGGGEIVTLMGTSAYYAPASAAVAMAEAYLLDQKRLLACAAYLDGEYGYKDLFIGVPCVIGGKGVEKIIELPLSEEEQAMLKKSAASVQAVVDVVKKG